MHDLIICFITGLLRDDWDVNLPECVRVGVWKVAFERIGAVPDIPDKGGGLGQIGVVIELDKGARRQCIALKLNDGDIKLPTGGRLGILGMIDDPLDLAHDSVTAGPLRAKNNTRLGADIAMGSSEEPVGAEQGGGTERGIRRGKNSDEGGAQIGICQAAADDPGGRAHGHGHASWASACACACAATAAIDAAGADSGGGGRRGEGQREVQADLDRAVARGGDFCDGHGGICGDGGDAKGASLNKRGECADLWAVAVAVAIIRGGAKCDLVGDAGAISCALAQGPVRGVEGPASAGRLAVVVGEARVEGAAFAGDGDGAGGGDDVGDACDGGARHADGVVDDGDVCTDLAGCAGGGGETYGRAGEQADAVGGGRGARLEIQGRGETGARGDARGGGGGAAVVREAGRRGGLARRGDARVRGGGGERREQRDGGVVRRMHGDGAGGQNKEKEKEKWSEGARERWHGAGERGGGA